MNKHKFESGMRFIEAPNRPINVEETPFACRKLGASIDVPVLAKRDVRIVGSLVTLPTGERS